MTIGFFFQITHLTMTLLVVGFILYIWKKYRKITTTTIDKNSNSLLYFALALVLWESNLFDTDYRYEVYTTIIVDSLLIMASAYFENGKLFIGKNSTHNKIKYIPILAIALIVLSQILINKFPNNQIIGYALAIPYTLVVFVIMSSRFFVYFKEKGFLSIGLTSCVAFLGMFVNIVVSVAYVDDVRITEWTKFYYIVFTFSLYVILVSLCFNFINDVLSRKLSQIYTSNIEDAPNIEGAKYAINDAMAIKADFQSMIVEDHIEELIEKLIIYSKDRPSMMQDIVIAANRLSAINTSKLRGTVDNDEYLIRRSQVAEAILKLLNRL